MNTNVNFEIAKLLKEKEFDIPVRNYYLLGDITNLPYEGFEDNYWGDYRIINWNRDVIGIKPFKGFISAPTIAEVVMWLYEKHGIWICVERDWDVGKCLGFEAMIDDNDGITNTATFNSPAEAYSSAIEYTLKNLI